MICTAKTARTLPIPTDTTGEGRLETIQKLRNKVIIDLTTLKENLRTIEKSKPINEEMAKLEILGNIRSKEEALEFYKAILKQKQKSPGKNEVEPKKFLTPLERRLAKVVEMPSCDFDKPRGSIKIKGETIDATVDFSNAEKPTVRS